MTVFAMLGALVGSAVGWPLFLILAFIGIWRWYKAAKAYPSERRGTLNRAGLKTVAKVFVVGVVMLHVLPFFFTISSQTSSGLMQSTALFGLVALFVPFVLGLAIYLGGRTTQRIVEAENAPAKPRPAYRHMQW